VRQGVRQRRSSERGVFGGEQQCRDRPVEADHRDAEPRLEEKASPIAPRRVFAKDAQEQEVLAREEAAEERGAEGDDQRDERGDRERTWLAQGAEHGGRASLLNARRGPARRRSAATVGYRLACMVKRRKAFGVASLLCASALAACRQGPSGFDL